MLAISASEINAAPVVGKTIVCYKCGKRHKVRTSSNGYISYFKCGLTTYVCGINGKDISKRFRK